MNSLATLTLVKSNKSRLAKAYNYIRTIFDDVLDSGGVVDDPYFYLETLGYSPAETNYIVGVYYTLREGGTVDNKRFYHDTLLAL